MNKYFLLVLLFFATRTQAQFDLMKNYYFNSLESSYQMEYGIILSSVKGNYEMSKSLLQTPYFKGNPDKALLLKALLSYNTLGKSAAFELIDAASGSAETKDFSKLWLSFHAKNMQDYAERLDDFKKKYPQNYEPFKLKFRKAIDYRDSNIWNSIFDQKQEALQSIDSLTNLAALKKEDRIYFSLLKLDFLKHKERDRKEGKEDTELSKEELLDQLLSLWKQDKVLFSPAYLQKLIGDCKSSDCKEALLYTSKELEKTNNLSASEKAYSLLINKDEKQSVSELERKITAILSSEKSEDQQLRIKVLLAVFSLPKEPNLGFFMKGLLKPIPFSKEFKQRYAAVANKTVLLGKIKTTFEGAEFEELKRETAINTKFKEELETLKSLSVEDVQAVYGMMLFSAYYAKSLKGLKTAFGSYSENPTPEEKKNYKKYIAFLEKNPLYYDSSRYKFNLVELQSEAEVMDFLKESQKLHLKYPGSSAILDNCIYSLAFNNKLVTEKEQQQYYLDYFKLVINVLEIKFSKSDKEEKDSEYFGTILNYNSSSRKSYFEDFYGLLSVDNKKEAESYLQKAIASYPENKDLSYFQSLIDKTKN